MAKVKNIFICQECGHESLKWMGQCPACKTWNSFVEEVKVKDNKPSKYNINNKATNKPININKIEITEEKRTSTQISELDRVLGGGIVKGSLILVGGDPGIGKSTLLLQMCQNIGKQLNVLYVSAEESAVQIKIRAQRLGFSAESVFLLTETNLSIIIELIKNNKPDIAIIDSIQTIYSPDISSAPGSVSQVREATGILMRIAKTMGTSIFIIGHVTKEGALAGPRVLEHMVDTVLYFEGERHASYRVLRAVKNRFGSTNEIGVFEMNDKGLREIKNPSELMLSGRPLNVSGSIVTCCMEGTRPMLVEVQALVSPTNFGMPRRTATGTDYNRVVLLMAVLEKRLGMQLASYDSYVNIAGGMKITEPALDLGIISAVASSFRNNSINPRTVVFGEVGLTGEVRAISMAEKRIMEASKMGFQTCILPKSNTKNLKNIKDINICGVETVNEALKYVM